MLPHKNQKKSFSMLISRNTFDVNTHLVNVYFFHWFVFSSQYYTTVGIKLDRKR